MAGLVKMFDQLPARTAERYICDVARDSSRIVWTKHAKERMLKRKITIVEALGVLQRPKCVREPGKDEHGSWRCVLRRLFAGRRIQVVVALEPQMKGKSRRLFVVTVAHHR